MRIAMLLRLPLRSRRGGGTEPFPVPMPGYLLSALAIATVLAVEWWMSLRPPWQVPQPFIKLLYISTTTALVWAAIGIYAWRMVQRYPITVPHVQRDIVAHSGMAILAVAAHCLRYLLVASGNTPVEGFTVANTTSLVSYFLRAQAITYATLYFGLVLLQRFILLGRRADRKASEAVRLRADLDRARLNSLQAQLRPHFLFNALNSVSSLMHNDPDRADLMLEQVAGLLRKSLSFEKTERVDLAEEIAFCRSYLEVQGVRFGERLTYQLDVAAEHLSFPVPALILQPLVENAVMHGMASSGAQTRVVIGSRRLASALLISISNSVSCDDGPLIYGVGLRNIEDRLNLLYGDQSRLSIVRSSTEFSARLTIPSALRIAGTPGGFREAPEGHRQPASRWD